MEVDYEPLDPVVDPRAAPEALLRFEHAGGDVDAAFAAAAHVVAARHAIPRVVAAPMETRGIAGRAGRRRAAGVGVGAGRAPHSATGWRTRSGSTPRRSAWSLPDVGGAFGSKGTPAPEAAAAAAAALRLGRPVKWAEDRFENFVAAYQGRGMEAEVELALDGHGRMLAVRARICRGPRRATCSPNTAAPPHTAAMLMCGCYDDPRRRRRA